MGVPHCGQSSPSRSWTTYTSRSPFPRSRISKARVRSSWIASARRSTSSSERSVDALKGDRRARSRISLACARPMPATARWSRRSGWSCRRSPRRIAPSDVGPSDSASGPRCARSAVELLLRHEPDAGAFLLAGLGEDELAAPAEPDAEHRRLRPLRAGLEVAQPARAHEVNPEDEIVALDGEQEVLPAPARALEASSVECRERRRERLQRRDVRRAGFLDRCARDERVELPHPRLDLG